jgi:hypothetical protein
MPAIWNFIPEAPVPPGMAALASGGQRGYLTKKAY